MDNFSLNEWAKICCTLAFDKKVLFQAAGYSVFLDLEEDRCLIEKDNEKKSYKLNEISKNNPVEEICNIIYVIANKLSLINKYGANSFCKEFSSLDIAKALMLAQTVDSIISYNKEESYFHMKDYS